MAEAIARPRYGCALHGAVRTLTAIRGVVPIVHSNAGCAIQDALASRAGRIWKRADCRLCDSRKCRSGAPCDFWRSLPAAGTD